MSERTRRYKESGAAAGLVRVEVLVAPEDRQAILDAASRLRQAYRKVQKAAPGHWSKDRDSLYDEAVRLFGPRCLWSTQPARTEAGLRSMAAHLRENGGMDAWRFASRILDEVGHPAR